MSRPPALLPPGLCQSEPESATWSRERRRRTAVYREFEGSLDTKLLSLRSHLDNRLSFVEEKLDRISTKLANVLDVLTTGHARSMESKLQRLEALHVCIDPSVDDVLDEMLKRKNTKTRVASILQPELEPSPDDAVHVSGAYEVETGMDDFYNITTADACIQTSGEWFPLLDPCDANNTASLSYSIAMTVGANIGAADLVMKDNAHSNCDAIEEKTAEPDFALHQQKLDYVKTIVHETDKLLKQGHSLEKVSRLLWTKDELDQLIFDS